MNNGHKSQNEAISQPGIPTQWPPAQQTLAQFPCQFLNHKSLKLTDERGKAGTRADRDAPVLQPVMRTIFPFMSTPSATWAADAV